MQRLLRGQDMSTLGHQYDNSLVSNAFGFLRLPMNFQPYDSDADWVITGVPFDMATSGRAGGRHGNQARSDRVHLRRHSGQLCSLGGITCRGRPPCRPICAVRRRTGAGQHDPCSPGAAYSYPYF